MNHFQKMDIYFCPFFCRRLSPDWRNFLSRERKFTVTFLTRIEKSCDDKIPFFIGNETAMFHMWNKKSRKTVRIMTWLIKPQHDSCQFHIVYFRVSKIAGMFHLSKVTYISKPTWRRVSKLSTFLTPNEPLSKNGHLFLSVFLSPIKPWPWCSGSSMFSYIAKNLGLFLYCRSANICSAGVIG